MNETWQDQVRDLRKSPLAIEGGAPAILTPFARYNSIGAEEAQAAKAVIDSGVLSQYIGAWHEDFNGGPKVKEFERAAQSYFQVKHAVTVNSWTSGLMAAVGAIGIEPGDEVIVSPWTMCASATAILNWNALPIFADIDPLTYCLDPASVESNITSRTRAILAVDIFGQSAPMVELMALAKRHGLKVISDTAQAPAALYQGRFAGTLADVGGYSLNYHKHIHTGEGGIVVTEDDEIADRLRLIRNHAEAVVGPKGNTSLTNMIGYNFRLGEIECAIGIEQLKKLDGFVASRQRAAERLTLGLKSLPGLQTPTVMPDCTHVYYIYPLTIDTERLGVDRAWLRSRLMAEGLEISAGYQNVHLLPMYQKQIAYGSTGFPWTAGFSRQGISYSKGICPVAERLHDATFMGIQMCKYEFTNSDIDAVIHAFAKVWAHLP